VIGRVTLDVSLNIQCLRGVDVNITTAGWMIFDLTGSSLQITDGVYGEG